MFMGLAAGIGMASNKATADNKLAAIQHEQDPNKGNWINQSTLTGEDHAEVLADYQTARRIDQLSEEQRREWAHLALTVYGEARGSDPQGMQAVANVVMNRVRDGRWGATVQEVVRARRQFSCWEDENYQEMMRQFENDQTYMALLGTNPEEAAAFKERMEQSADWRAFQLAKRISWKVYSGQLPDITNGAIFYHTPAVNPSWNASMERTVDQTIGGHIFYRES